MDGQDKMNLQELLFVIESGNQMLMEFGEYVGFETFEDFKCYLEEQEEMDNKGEGINDNM